MYWVITPLLRSGNLVTLGPMRFGALLGGHFLFTDKKSCKPVKSYSISNGVFTLTDTKADGL